MKIDRKGAVLGIAGVLASFAAFLPSDASASCREVIEDGGCIEQVLCAPGRVLGWDCVQ